MKMVGGTIKKEMTIDEILKYDFTDSIKISGTIHSIRKFGEIAFIILRKRDGLFQCTWEKGTSKFGITDIKEADIIECTGTLRKEEKAPHGIEMQIKSIKILSESMDSLPLDISKWQLKTSLEAKLDYRSISLRHPHERAKFRIQEGIGKAFREFLYKEGFTEIHTPKISTKSAETGASVFTLDYFHHPAILQQSPQIYKQMMIGVFDKVFEVAPVFRAEKHSTKRHLNEYTSLDFEVGYIDSFEDIMEIETKFLQYTMKLLQKEYANEIKILKIKLPKVESIPAIRFDEAKDMLQKEYDYQFKSPYDLEPEEEELIGKLFKEKYDSDFVFITHYPSKKRPFYTMDDSSDSRYTLSFDLLFRGLEITTGGQRIHDYKTLVSKMEKLNINTEGLETYLDTFKYGLPPHGGLGIGLERITKQLVGADSIKEVSLFPRDMKRLTP